MYEQSKINPEVVDQVEKVINKAAVQFRKPENITAQNLTALSKLLGSYKALAEQVDDSDLYRDYYSEVESGAMLTKAQEEKLRKEGKLKPYRRC